MAVVKIKYVSKSSNAHEGITHLGSDTWRWTKSQVIESIVNKTNSFYTESGGKRAEVEVRSGKFGQYLQTHVDGVWSNNLLSLPDFPVRTVGLSR